MTTASLTLLENLSTTVNELSASVTNLHGTVTDMVVRVMRIERGTTEAKTPCLSPEQTEVLVDVQLILVPLIQAYRQRATNFQQMGAPADYQAATDMASRLFLLSEQIIQHFPGLADARD